MSCSGSNSSSGGAAASSGRADVHDDGAAAGQLVAIRLAGRHRRRVEREAGQQPAERRARVPGLGRAGHDQAVDRARRRDVDDALLLLGLRRLLELGGLLVPRRVEHAAGRVRHAQPRPPVPEHHDLAADGRLAAAAVGDHDDGELEALGGVDRHQPDGVARPLLGQRGLGLARQRRRLRGRVGEEARQVGPAQRLVVARQADQLAHVGEAAAARRAGRGRRGRSRGR